MRQKLSQPLARGDTQPSRSILQNPTRKEPLREPNRVVAKEADSFDFPKWPSASKSRQWKLAVRRETSSKSARPTDAMQWFCEIDTAESLTDLASSMSITDTGTAPFQTLDMKIASALIKILHGDFAKRILIEDERQQKSHQAMLTGRQIAWMIFNTSSLRTSMVR